MFELSLHILDLVQNSITAGATLVVIEVIYDTDRDTLTITIKDDGKGMDEALLARVTSPFATTRTTRKVGLGIPMFKQCAEMCDGTFTIESKLGEGTCLTATFRRSHLDLPPLGDLIDTMRSLILGSPDKPDFRLLYQIDEKEFCFDTREIRQALGPVPLNEPAVMEWIHEALKEGFDEVESTHNEQSE
ncbi:ATP-binding protein [Eubacteriales bacterium OttesenSCG-928-N13]|nr:ATP-binding protein [Eubacteriales bacterium OttesenSCG-928-N13]